MKLTVEDIKHVLSADIDVSKQVDVKDIDSLVFSCVEAAKDALNAAAPPRFSDFERDQLVHIVDGLQHSHASIRKLLQGEQNPSAVDALAIARLQLETLYSFCFLLQNPENVRLYLKSGWKKKYIRYLLHREECHNLPRFDEYFNEASPPLIIGLQNVCFVDDDERRTIENEQLGAPFGPISKLAIIPNFPTPMGVIEKITDTSQASMLKRLYPEYQFLCSFAHGDSEASLFRTLSNKRSPAAGLFTSGQIEDFYQRYVLEQPVLYSAVSAIQVATELAAIYKTNVDLLAKVTKAWNFLLTLHLLAKPIWEIRAKQILGLIDQN